MYFLTQTECGKKYPNGIVYAGVLMAVLNTYFGLLYRFASYCYSLKRLNAYKRKIDVRISNTALQAFGFRHIRNKVVMNRRA